MPSSVIAHTHYNADSQVLTVVFVAGTVYEYVGVPQPAYEAMKAAPSKGVYFNEEIKPHYAYRKVK